MVFRLEEGDEECLFSTRAGINSMRAEASSPEVPGDPENDVAMSLTSMKCCSPSQQFPLSPAPLSTCFRDLAVHPGSRSLVLLRTVNM